KNINEFKEIIIVDDDSDGQEIEKLTHYIRKYRNIKLVCNKENKGAGGARNTGMKESTGKWLLFSDSDDEFLPACYEQLCQYESCDSDIVFFPPTSRDEFGNIGNRHNVYVSYYNYYWQKDDECYLRYKLPV